MQFNNIFKFNGGVHPEENKSLSTTLPIARLPIPKKLVLPLRPVSYTHLTLPTKLL
jgi:electron transport complex protein RnfC